MNLEGEVAMKSEVGFEAFMGREMIELRVLNILSRLECERPHDEVKDALVGIIRLAWQSSH